MLYGLEGGDEFRIAGAGCYEQAHIIAEHPVIDQLSDEVLSNWGCSVHNTFTGYPEGTTLDEVESTVTAGSSSLSFSGGTYHYVWKTAKAWAGSCRRLVVGLDDGSRHMADFRLR